MTIEAKIQEKIKAVEAEYYSKVQASAAIKHDPRSRPLVLKNLGPPATLIFGRRYYNKKQFLRWLTDREQKPAMRRAAAKGGARK